MSSQTDITEAHMIAIPDPTAYDFCRHAKVVLPSNYQETVACELGVPLGAQRGRATTHLWRYMREPWPVCEGCGKRESSLDRT